MLTFYKEEEEGDKKMENEAVFDLFEAASEVRDRKVRGRFV